MVAPLPRRRAPDDPWVRRRAAPVRFRDRLVLTVLVGGGAASCLLLADWWFRPGHVAQPALFVLLSLAFWYGAGRIVVGWVNYLGVARPEHVPAPTGLRVAVFTTSSPGEPLSMFETTLAACARIRYPHTTYLLDDTRDPRFREVAERQGAVWLELAGLPGAKAGKINRALELTDEEFVLVLDPDHVPFPEFLDRTLGHLADPRVGFVQVCQAYYNQGRSFVARGAGTGEGQAEPPRARQTAQESVRPDCDRAVSLHHRLQGRASRTRAARTRCPGPTCCGTGAESGSCA